MPVANINIKAFRDRWLDLHHSYETTSYRLFKNALDKQIKTVIDEVNRNGVFAINYFLQFVMPSEPMAIAYEKCYREIGVKNARFTDKFIREVAREQEQKGRFRSEDFDRLMIAYFRQWGALRVAEVDRTTIEYIQLVLEEGRLKGLSTSELADYLVEEIGDPAYSRRRSLVIARTESSNAANYGAYMAGQNSDYETEKIWIGAEDSRERLSHFEKNGERMAITMPYTVNRYKGGKGKEILVGQDLMLHPGDQVASAENLVNCRCSIAYVPILDEIGLPVLRRVS